MTTPGICAALERLVELGGHLNETSPGWIQEWTDAIAAARAALAAEPVGEGEVNLELMAALIEIQRLRDLCQTLAAPPAPEPGEVGEVPAAWLYKGDPDFDGTTWRDNWRVTTDEQVARFKAGPGCPVPLFRRPAPPAPEPGAILRERHGSSATADWLDGVGCHG